MCFKFKMKIKFCSRLFYDLIIFLLASLFLLYVFKATIFINILNFFNMLVFKHKLLIQIFKINDIEADHVDFIKVDKNRIFK